MRLLAIVACMVLASGPVAAQEQQSAPETPSVEQGFVEATRACLDLVIGGEGAGEAFEVQVKPASPEVRASHPFGAEASLRELASRSDGKVTLRAPNERTCSTFAVGAPPAAAFEQFATVLTQRGGFSELEVRRREEGRVQRTFRSDDGRVRVELEGFVGGMPAMPGGDLAMAHIGRRR